VILEILDGLLFIMLKFSNFKAGGEPRFGLDKNALFIFLDDDYPGRRSVRFLSNESREEYFA